MKQPTEDQTGLKKLPKSVRNKMGYMKNGGKVKAKGMAMGGKVMGYKNGGAVTVRTNQKPHMS